MKIIMSKNRKAGRRWLSWPWLAGLAALVVLGLWSLWGLNRPAPPPPKPLPPAAAAPARMEGLSLTEVQEGDRRWVLEAKKADFRKEQMEISISGVGVEFFGPGEHIRVRADEGLFHTKSRVLTLKGNVEMQRGDLLIKTSLATYQPNERVLLAPEEVTLTEPNLKVQGKGLKVELAEKRLVLAQHQLTEFQPKEWGLKP